MRERLLAAVLAPRGVVCRLELEAEARVYDVKHGDDAVQDMHPDAIVPHRVLPLLKRRLARDPTPWVSQVQIPYDPRRLGEVAPVRKL